MKVQYLTNVNLVCIKINCHHLKQKNVLTILCVEPIENVSNSDDHSQEKLLALKVDKISLESDSGKLKSFCLKNFKLFFDL